MNDNKDKIYQLTDEILFYFWDPIGINQNFDARDEYADYVQGIVNILTIDDSALCDYIFDIETSKLGLDGSLSHCRKIADMLIDMKSCYV